MSMNHIITLKCDTCSHVFDIDLSDYDVKWELVDTFDHGDNAMGIENHYEAMIDVDCVICHNTIRVKLNIWEYPDGAYNYQEIIVEGAEKLNDFDLSYFSPIVG